MFNKILPLATIGLFIGLSTATYSAGSLFYDESLNEENATSFQSERKRQRQEQGHDLLGLEELADVTQSMEMLPVGAEFLAALEHVEPTYEPATKKLDTKEYASFEPSPKDIKTLILGECFYLGKDGTTNFRDIGINLSLVCKDWGKIIRENAKKWVCEYFNIEEENREVFWRLFKGKLIYKPDPNSNHERVDLFISALPNPLEGEFDLSRCGEAAQLLSINMGYPKVAKPENGNKIEIWLAAQFFLQNNINNHFLQNNLNEDRHFLVPIIEKWTETVGLQFNLEDKWSGDEWSGMEISTDKISDNNLFDIWERGHYGVSATTKERNLRAYRLMCTDHGMALAHFMFDLKNQNEKSRQITIGQHDHGARHPT